MLRLMDDAGPRQTLEIDPLRRARALIEANLAEPLSLEALAAAAGLSAYHFTRQFAARFGLSPMAFVRERRMALAAVRLTHQPPPALVDLAFDLGFESQEGFTRAFKRAYGVSPGRFRRAQNIYEETPVMTEIATPPRLAMEPAPVKKPGFRVAGVSGVFDEASKSGIPMLWPRLAQKLPVAGQLGDASYGVCCGAAEGEGVMTYMAAVPIAADAAAPEGLEVRDIPDQTYLIFRQQTDGSFLHPQMQAAAREIWGERLPASGFKLADGPDLEAYPPGFEPDQPSYVEWWIPVEA
jgi:AraC family transcriptional regulator